MFGSESWVLIAWLIGGVDGHPLTAEFSTLETCQAAITKIATAHDRRLDASAMQLSVIERREQDAPVSGAWAICVPK